MGYEIISEAQYNSLIGNLLLVQKNSWYNPCEHFGLEQEGCAFGEMVSVGFRSRKVPLFVV